MLLSTKSLRNYLLQQPLVDWLDRYGAQWLHRETTPVHFRELPTDGKVRAGLPLTADTQPLAAIDEGPPPSCQSSFYKWVLAECAAQQLRAPTVVDYDQAAAYSVSTALADTHASWHTVYEYPLLASESYGLSTMPVALVSGCLAAKLFGPHRPATHAIAPFASWVAVFKPTSANKAAGVVSTTAKGALYDALQCQVAQRALDDTNLNDGQWGGNRTATPPTTQRITCVLLDPKHPERLRIWLRTTGPLPEECQRALAWQREVRDKGTAATWDPLQPGDRLELCAPLGPKIPDRWRAICAALLEATDDMGRVYKLGTNARAAAWALGARTYHDLWSMQQTLAPLKLSALTLSMAWSNHRDNPERTVAPRRLTKPSHKALVQRTRTKPWFVVDFETLQVGKQLWLFMVATVFVDPRTSPPTKRVFTHRVPTLTPEAQATMLVAWADEMRACLASTAPQEARTGRETTDAHTDGGTTPTPETDAPLTNTPILHWSSAEPSFLKRLLTRSTQVSDILRTLCPATHTLLATQATQRNGGGLCWCDVYTVFRQEPITVAGCFDFKLKHVVKALVALGKLSNEHIWAVEGPQDGLAAMQRAEYGYASGDDSVFHDIVKYNEADVLVLYGVMVEVLWGMVG